MKCLRRCKLYLAWILTHHLWCFLFRWCVFSGTWRDSSDGTSECVLWITTQTETCLESVRARHHFEPWWFVVTNGVELLGENGFGTQRKWSYFIAIFAYERPGPVFHVTITIHHVEFAAHNEPYCRTHEGLPIQPTVILVMQLVKQKICITAHGEACFGGCKRWTLWPTVDLVVEEENTEYYTPLRGLFWVT
jgi:hypothetical protein